MHYQPQPFDTSQVELTTDILELTEQLARNIHEVWARGRVNEGWSYGTERNDERREHPCLVPYEELPESEKEYDRNTALQTLRTVVALGYSIQKTSKFATSKPMIKWRTFAFVRSHIV